MATQVRARRRRSATQQRVLRQPDEAAAHAKPPARAGSAARPRAARARLDVARPRVAAARDGRLLRPPWLRLGGLPVALLCCRSGAACSRPAARARRGGRKHGGKERGGHTANRRWRRSKPTDERAEEARPTTVEPRWLGCCHVVMLWCADRRAHACPRHERTENVVRPRREGLNCRKHRGAPQRSATSPCTLRRARHEQHQPTDSHLFRTASGPQGARAAPLRRHTAATRKRTRAWVQQLHSKASGHYRAGDTGQGSRARALAAPRAASRRRAARRKTVRLRGRVPNTPISIFGTSAYRARVGDARWCPSAAAQNVAGAAVPRGGGVRAAHAAHAAPPAVAATALTPSRCR